MVVPLSIGFALMAASSLIVASGLRAKERLRAALLAAGAVWTAHEALARRLHLEREAAQRHVDNLPGGCLPWGRGCRGC